MTKRLIRTTVIIPCYNGEAFLHKLLHLLSREPCKVVAIDDNSQDGTWQVLGQYDFVRRRRNTEGLGFAQVNNSGARLADTPYLLFLNQDTEPEKGFIKAMETRMRRRKKTAVVGAKLVFARPAVDHLIFRGRVVHLTRMEGKIDHAGIDLNRQLLPFEVGRNESPTLPRYNKARMYPGVTGACVLIKSDVFEELGGFHTAYRNGWEDSDLCLRAWEAGYQVWYEPKAFVRHFHSTSDIRFAREDQNVDLWVKRWHTDGRLKALVGQYKKEWGEK